MLFTQKTLRPMLIGAQRAAFDSPDHLYELKADGQRCIAYLDPQGGTELRDRLGAPLLPVFPELSELHRAVSRRCILDGELTVMREGKPSFAALDRAHRAGREDTDHACFMAFDLLYLCDRSTMELPLYRRKALLQENIPKENDRLVLTRTVDRQGTEFFRLIQNIGLEGIIAKRKNSRYLPGERTGDWIRCDCAPSKDCVICGYLPQDTGVFLLLGQYAPGGDLSYQGQAQVSEQDFRMVRELPLAPQLFAMRSAEQAVWVRPELCCTVTDGAFKGFRTDKTPAECLTAKGL